MAAVDYFLKVDGIVGESADHKHREEIDIESWSWGEVNGSDPGNDRTGTGVGKVKMGEFVFHCKTSKASGPLLLACAQGSSLRHAILTCRKVPDGEYLKI